MSVLASKRSESKAQFVMVAYDIYDETIRFLTRVSARYARLVAQPIAELAGSLLDNCESANAIYPQGKYFAMKMEERTRFLILARANLRALDVRLLACYRQMNKNPAGSFTDTLDRKDGAGAVARLDHMADKLGQLIAREEALIDGVIRSDSSRTG